MLENLTGPFYSSLTLEIRPLDILAVLARAHDIPVPSGIPDSEIRKAVTRNPRFTTTPLLRLLLIPESDQAPLQQKEIQAGPGVDDRLSQILGCRFVDHETLYSQDQLTIVRHLIPLSQTGRF